MFAAIAAQAKTLIVYYSFTNNVERIVNELGTMIDADIVEVEPAEKGIDYAADNYAAGSALIAAIRNNPDNPSSYPAIDPSDINPADYDCILIGAPLWWSSMAAPLQTYLFRHGKEMSGKNIGLIVSSASSGISGVEADAKRLVPDGNFATPSLWIRSSQTREARTLLEEWLKEIDYDSLSAAIRGIQADQDGKLTVYSLSGELLLNDTGSLDILPNGIYIINGKKTAIAR